MPQLWAAASRDGPIRVSFQISLLYVAVEEFEILHCFANSCQHLNVKSRCSRSQNYLFHGCRQVSVGSPCRMANTELRIGSQPALYPSHPLAPTYLRRDLPAVDVRNLWRLRDEGNCPLPNSKSATSASFSASKHSVEFASVSSFRDTLRKHTRSPCSPSQKYKYGSATAHEIGWFLEDSPIQKIGLRRPKHGLKESETTRYYNNMKATLSEASLRLILP